MYTSHYTGKAKKTEDDCNISQFLVFFLLLYVLDSLRIHGQIKNMFIYNVSYVCGQLLQTFQVSVD